MSDKINPALARYLIASQFPRWKNLPIKAVLLGGWDNRTFHLGEEMIIRMPSDEKYAAQVEKEQKYLPKLAPHLPFPIPKPLAMGKPTHGYPWHWSIYQWLEGKTPIESPPQDLVGLASSLAQFFIALHKIDPEGGLPPGPHSFYRGGALSIYDGETKQAIPLLKGKIDTDHAMALWEKGLASSWKRVPVWVHGDMSPGNILLHKGELSGVIDFGQLTIGDPACDLVIAWTLFKGESREAFRKKLPLDPKTWDRAAAWALWKALIIASGLREASSYETTQSLYVIEEILKD